MTDYFAVLNITMVSVLLPETINIACFNFISRMHDLQWWELPGSHGSHRVRQDLSALGSSDTTPAQILAWKVKSHRISLPWISLYKLLFILQQTTMENLPLCFPYSTQADNVELALIFWLLPQLFGFADHNLGVIGFMIRHLRPVATLSIELLK